MPNEPYRFSFRNVVLIADVIDTESRKTIGTRRDLEQTDPGTLANITSAINDLGKHLVHYENPTQLAQMAEKHKDDIVLSIYGGSISRNRMALVPSICETFGLRFVGPDTYGRVMCQDKEVSKSIAQACGLITAPHRIVRKKEDLNRIEDFPLPYVAKPIWEGSSIGITGSSLVEDRLTGLDVIAALLHQFNQPVMIEAFIPGREVSWCFVETNEFGLEGRLAEILWSDDPAYFDTHLYDAEHKLIAEGNKVVRNMANLSGKEQASLEALLRMVGLIGYGRIDGKLQNDEFTFLEITPDAWLGPTGTFASSFINTGFSFTDVIARVLLSARKVPQDQ